MPKEILRTEIKRRLAATTVAERKLWSEQICQRLMQEPRLCKTSIIMAYYPLADEVDIKPLLYQLTTIGKTILLPEVISQTEMILRRFTPEAALKNGVLGTQVPQGDVFEKYGSIGAVIVPGRAFTTCGHRLGRGKGYYDTFLAKLPQAYKLGVCFPFQIVDNIPCEPHDIKVDHVQT